jgi:phosphoribosylaminoimidazolecarboxamide formyltransferase/IMP cyclohydrolase
MKKTALISVYNKEGIVDFAKELIRLGYDILSSGGTAKALTEAGLTVTDVAEVTGMPAILSHRVVTLHPKIFGGILALDTKEHRAELAQYGIPWIDLVCVDFYPLKDAINEVNVTKEKVIERTDIGGPTMVRAAAKARRIVVCDAADRTRVISWMKEGEQDRETFLDSLAAKAEFVVAEYVLSSAKYHSHGKYTGELFEQAAECKYGENAWQKPAALDSAHTNDTLSLPSLSLVEGTLPSYNNYADIDRLLQTVTHIAAGFDVNFGEVPFIAVSVKHGNSCGAAVGSDAKDTLQRMMEGDVRAIFGGVVLTNATIDETLAETLVTYRMESGRRLLDTIVAPKIEESARALLKRKGDKCRLLELPALATLSKNSLDTRERSRYVRGGQLRQPNYTFVLDFAKPEVEKKGSEASKEMLRDMVLAWAIGSTSNSNTVTVVKNGSLIGNGVGQQDRITAAWLAENRARFSREAIGDASAARPLEGAVAYSDSFFPFPDAPEVLLKAGVLAVVATSGSVNDPKTVALFESYNRSLIWFPDALGRGFYAH